MSLLIFLIFAITPLPFICSMYPISPSIILYEGKNQTGKSLAVQTAYIPDLTKKSFDNRVQSLCVNGTWLLYTNSHYNKEIGAMEYVSGNSYCTNLHTTGQEVSSIKFVGSALDTESDSITFYSSTYFQGDEEYFTESETNVDFDVLKNGSNSVIVTGTLGWRLFGESNFKGVSICIEPDVKFPVSGISRISNISQPQVRLVPNIKEEYGESVGAVLSFRQENCNNILFGIK